MELSELVIKMECGTKSGTAFFISKNRALTAYHIVIESNDNEIICIDNSGKKIKAKLSAKVTEQYKKLDIALLELEEDVQFAHEFSFTNYKEIKSGTNWISRGFPSAKKNSGDNILHSDSNIVNQQLKCLRNNKIDIELEHSKKLSTYAGFSGSPLVINNSIAGIINQELLENGESKELTALSIKHFQDLLKSEGVDVIEKETSLFNPLRKILSHNWFEQHIDKGIESLGARYTPEVNVKIDVTKKIDALLKNKGFCEDARSQFHNYLLALNKLIENFSSYSDFEQLSSEYSTQISLIDQISLTKQEIQTLFEEYCDDKCTLLDLDELGKQAEVIHGSINKLAKLYLGNGFSDEKMLDANGASVSFFSFLEQPDIHTLIANQPYLLLKGKAGTGKSHLLADAAAAQQKINAPAILLLGQHFTTDKAPWTQILSDILRLEGTEQQFLGALNEIGQERGQRVLFSIDAINEGRGKFFWAEHFVSFVNDFKNYPWISLIISVRDTYFPKLIPEHFGDKTAMKITSHMGFVGCEYEAVKVFFNHYKIRLPKIPYINAEFSNPLFLKLFCDGLQNRGLHEVPEGYGGISSVMNYFIDNIDMKLGHPEFYGYDSSGKVCRKIVNGLVKHKQANNLSYVPYDDACDIANGVVARYSSKRGIIEDLVHEGLLSKNLYWLNDGQDEEGIYFAYERLDDHFLADFLARTIVTSTNISQIFKVNGQLLYLFEYEYRYQGVIEALSILLPELYGKELFELVDENYQEERTIINAFINSLIWRNLDTIKSNCTDYINKTVFQYEDSFKSFLEFMYTVSGDVKHPYNANKLHNMLSEMPLADRDAEWTTHLQYVDDPENSIGRMLEWVPQSDMHKILSDESALLLSISISWLLVSTTIELRNRATQALSNILINRLNLGLKLLKLFDKIDDPYVHERIFAAVYGATLNTTQLSELPDLAEYIVEEIFLKEEVYPNVLVRDYARNIVEYALYKEKIQLTNTEVIRPPYNSSIPENFPINEEIDSYKFDSGNKDFKKSYYSQNEILSSMVTEYGRGTCRYGNFGRYTFQSALHLWENIDPNPLSNYACKLIFEKFGYNVDIHGQFDRHTGEGNRFENKVERIGKKYQWLALYEVVARLADNVQLTDWDGNEIGYFQGPWQNNLRSIDPTFPPQKTNSRELPVPVNTVSYDSWSEENGSWIISEDNLPDPKEMIVNREFLSLEAYFSWHEPERLGVDRKNSDRKKMWYQIRSYLVKDSENENLKNWLKNQDFMGRWMPESNENYSVFSKEYYWSPAYKDKVADNDELRWQSIHKKRNDRDDEEIIAEVLSTAEEHRWEGSEGTSFLAPRSEMFDGMSLSSSEIPSCWFNDDGQLACFDPHVFGEERSELLVNKQVFEKFLNAKGLKIIWTVLGEKQVLGSSHAHAPAWIDMSGVYCLEDGSVEGSMTIDLKELGWKSKQDNEKIN
jgi:V8-like Glu-specific endopeptidase